MKKVLTVLMLVPLLIGCSTELEIHDSISEEDQAVYHPLPIAKYKDGYYIQDNNTLYYVEENKSTLINYCYFRDDQFLEGNHGTYKRYDSYIIAEMGFYVLDDAIYTLASYMNVEVYIYKLHHQLSYSLIFSHSSYKLSISLVRFSIISLISFTFVILV